MDKKMKTLVFLFLVLPMVLSSQTISETNFSGVVGAGARALGMGGAFIAIADDATAASWNPGGLGQLEKPEITLVLRFQNYRNMIPASGDGQFLRGPEDLLGNSYGFDFVSITYPIRIGDFKIVPQVSYQRAISYDLEFNMNDVYSISEQYISELDAQVDFQGSFTEKQKFTGGVDVISLSVGSRFFKRFNIGISANFWMNGYEGELNRNFSGKIFSEDIPSLQETVEFMTTEHLDVDIKGLNFNIGLLVDVLENLKIGVVYKSSFTANDKYSVFFSQEDIQGETDTEPFEVRRSDSSPLKWPATWGLGISYRPIDPFTISADITTTLWSTAIMKNFPIHDDRGELVRVTDVYFPTMKPASGEEGERFRQLDTRQFRLGLEYVLIGKRTLIPLRLGFFTDSQYYSNSSGTRITYIGVTGGVGVKRGGFSVDLAFLYESGSYLRDNIDYTVTRFAEVRVYLSTNYSF